MRRLVRCKINKYSSPLMSFDEKGIYVKCKDCRETKASGEVKRGTYHLVPWSTLISYMQQAGVQGAEGQFFIGDPVAADRVDGKEDTLLVESVKDTDDDQQTDATV